MNSQLNGLTPDCAIVNGNGHSQELTKNSTTREIDEIYETVERATTYIRSVISPVEPTIGIICGSGLHDIGDIITEPVRIPFENVPGLADSKVLGHKNVIVAGTLNDKGIICFQGRCHYYEGFPLTRVVLPVRIMKQLGIRLLIVTNSAGGINPTYKVGDIMIIKDHISYLSLAGNNPLRGENDNMFGTRFPSMLNAYDRSLRQMLKKISNKLELSTCLHTGVYCNIGGPSYETLSELRMLRAGLGDAVGMSTGPEVIVARHCGIKVCGLSLISNRIDLDENSDDDETVQTDAVVSNGTAGQEENGFKLAKEPHDVPNGNLCVGIQQISIPKEVTHDEVLETASTGVRQMALIIKELVKAMPFN